MAFDQTENGLLVPEEIAAMPEGPAHVVIDNRTGLPEDAVRAAVGTYFEERASWTTQDGYSFQSYANEGSLLARRRFETPGSVFEEIRLARELAERDDDIRATIGAMIAIAYRDGMENTNEDEQALHVFNKIARSANLDGALKRMYHEYLIAGQVTTVTPFIRRTFEIRPASVTRVLSRSVAAPTIGIIPAENIRVMGDGGMGGPEILAFKPPNEMMRSWLEEFFNPNTTAATKAAMRRERPVWAAMLISEIEYRHDEDFIGRYKVYRLNDRMCARTKMPGGHGPYPTPPLAADFALLEAKRLLNIMDYSLLQGGTNYIVIARKGSDQLPALPDEITNLRQVVRSASRSGVIIGDHRLSLDIITPNLTELLNAEKREMLGRQLSATMLRIPKLPIDNPGGEGEKFSGSVAEAVISSDRNDIRRHVENNIYEEVVSRNRDVFGRAEAAKIWQPKIVLQALQVFTDMILKLRDRGDIPRRYAVEAGGFDYDAAVQERQREMDRGDDEVMAPGPVPFTSPNTGPQDNNQGRPPGPGNDPARPRQTVTRNQGETVRAYYDDELGQVVRIGELTERVLEQYPDHTIGRVTALERTAIERNAIGQDGPLIVVPVNPSYRIGELRAVRLDDATSVIVGARVSGGGLVAKALCFRDGSHTIEGAEERALRWGFAVPERDDEQGE